MTVHRHSADNDKLRTLRIKRSRVLRGRLLPVFLEAVLFLPFIKFLKASETKDAFWTHSPAKDEVRPSLQAVEAIPEWTGVLPTYDFQCS
jgi:hypothetical protein